METSLLRVEVLAIGAHPDDVDLACSGTLAKMVEAGHKVGVIDLTAGEMGTRGDRETRLRESHDAGEIMGLSFRACLYMPDTMLEKRLDYEKKIVDAIRIVRPRILMLPLGYDTHPDHLAASELASSAWYKAGFGKYDSKEKPFRPERMVRYFLGQEATPSFVVDVSAQMEKRRNAILSFKSQFFNNDSGKFEGKTKLVLPNFLDQLETRLKYYGSRILKPYGEPFLIKELPEITHPAILADESSVFRD